MTATTILLTPTVPLDEGTSYTVTLRTGLQGLSSDNQGIRLQGEHVWSFRTAGQVTPVFRVYLPLVERWG